MNGDYWDTILDRHDAIRRSFLLGWLTTDEARWLSAGLPPLSRLPALRIRPLTTAELEGVA